MSRADFTLTTRLCATRWVSIGPTQFATLSAVRKLLRGETLLHFSLRTSLLMHPLPRSLSLSLVEGLILDSQSDFNKRHTMLHILFLFCQVILNIWIIIKAFCISTTALI